MENKMIVNYRHTATQKEVVDIYKMPVEEARKISAGLALTHTALFGWYANRRPNALPLVGTVPNTDIQRVALELGLKITEEPQADQEYTLAPYCPEGPVAIIGIALWARRPEATVRNTG